MEKKKIIKFLIEGIFLTLICVAVSYVLIKDSFFDVIKIIKNLNVWNVFILCFIVAFLIMSNGHILKKVASNFNEKFSETDGMHTSLIGSLFSGITPFKVGYQFGVLYSYNKKGIKVKEGITVSYVECSAYQFMITGLCVLLSLFIAFNPVRVEIGGNVINLNAIIYIVTGINIVASTFLIVVVKFKKIHEYIIKIISKISSFFFRKRDSSIIENKIRTSLNQIVDNSSMLFENKKQTISIVFINLIRAIAMYSLPYIIYLFLSKTNFDINQYFICLAYAMIITFCLWIVPIPGGAGASEMLFYLLYSQVIAEAAMIKASVLVWRFFTYYINLILGLIVLLIIKKKDINKELLDSQGNTDNKK